MDYARYLSDLGAYLPGLLAPLSGEGTAESYAVGLSLLILLVLLVSACGFWWREVWRPKRELGRVITRFDRVRDRSALAAELPAIERAFRSSKLLHHPWTEFDETMLRPEPEGPAVVRITTRPGNYFNREGCGLSHPVWHALPHYFVGFGLIFTFIGLVAGLYAMQESIAGTAEEATNGLETLLRVAKFKFLTSISGIFSSIIFSFIYHAGIRKIDSIFEKLCRKIEDLTEFATVESIADRQLVQLHKQREQLERFNTNIAMQIVEGIANKIDATIVESLRRAIEPLNQTLERLAAGIGNQNLEALNQMAEAFRRQLESGAASEFRVVGETLRQLGDSLGGLTRQFGEQAETFRRRMEEMTHGLAEAVQGAGSSLGSRAGEAAAQMRAGVEDGARVLQAALEAAGADLETKLGAATMRIAEALEPIGGRLASFESTLARFDERFTSQARALDQLISRTLQVAGVMEAAADAMRGAAAPVAESSGRLELATRELVQGVAQLSDISKGLDEIGRRLEEASAAVEQSWRSYAARFDSVDENLEEIFSKFVEGIGKYQSTVNEFLVGLNDGLEKTIRALSGGVERMDDSISGFSDNIEELRRVADRMSQTTVEMSGAARNISDVFTKITGRSQPAAAG